jgi:hypothetical protein
MTEQAPLTPPGETEDFRPVGKPGLKVPDIDRTTGDLATPTGPAPAYDQSRVQMIRVSPVMTEMHVDGRLIAVAQATSTVSGPWGFRFLPEWENRDAAETIAAAMAQAAVDAARAG